MMPGDNPLGTRQNKGKKGNVESEARQETARLVPEGVENSDYESLYFWRNRKKRSHVRKRKSRV